MRSKQELIDEVLDCFNFDLVYRAMVALNWKWHNLPEPSIPTVDQAKVWATDLMSRAYDASMRYGEDGFIASGGFKATYEPECNEMTLEFIVYDWTAEDH